MIQKDGEVIITEPREQEEIDERVFYRSAHPEEKLRPKRYTKDILALILCIVIIALAIIGIALTIIIMIKNLSSLRI